MLLLLLLWSRSAVLASSPPFSEVDDNERVVFFQQPLLRAVKNVRVDRKNGQVYVHFDCVVENTNGVGIVIRPSSLNLSIGGQDFGRVRTVKKMKVKRKTEAVYPVVLSGEADRFAKGVLSSAWHLILGKKVDLSLKGQLNARVFLFKKKWEVNYVYPMTGETFKSFFQ